MPTHHTCPGIKVKIHAEINPQNSSLKTANSKRFLLILHKIPSPVYLFYHLFSVLLTSVTIVLPKGNQREAGRLGNGVEGGSTLVVVTRSI